MKRSSRPPLFDVQSISKHFGSVIALRQVSMTVRGGEVMWLLGDNGAGESALIETPAVCRRIAFAGC